MPKLTEAGVGFDPLVDQLEVGDLLRRQEWWILLELLGKVVWQSRQGCKRGCTSREAENLKKNKILRHDANLRLKFNC